MDIQLNDTALTLEQIQKELLHNWQTSTIRWLQKRHVKRLGKGWSRNDFQRARLEETR